MMLIRERMEHVAELLQLQARHFEALNAKADSRGNTTLAFEYATAATAYVNAAESILEHARIITPNPETHLEI